MSDERATASEALMLGAIPSTYDENSIEAAESLEDHVPRLRRLVLELVIAHEPIACWQIEELLGMSHQTVSARVWELHRGDRIERCGKNVAPSGRRAWLYRVTRASGDE